MGDLKASELRSDLIKLLASATATSEAHWSTVIETVDVPRSTPQLDGAGMRAWLLTFINALTFVNIC